METPKPFWYVQPFNSDNNVQTDIVKHLEMKGIEYTRMKYLPFGMIGDVVQIMEAKKGPIVAVGTINMVRYVQQCIKNMKPFEKIYPFVWCDFEKLSCRSYYTHLGAMLLQYKYGFYTLGEIERQRDDLYYMYGNEESMIFIRPDSNDKIFDGMLVHHQNFRFWLNMVKKDNLDPTTLCVVSKPLRKLIGEDRIVVANGKAIAGSGYIRHGDLVEVAACHASYALAEKAAAVWSPHPIFVIDVAYDESNIPKILEVGSVNTAGWYSSDIPVIVDAINEQATKEWEELNMGDIDGATMVSESE